MMPPISFEHLSRLCDDRGLYEHAKLTVRREEHGYCTDDNARLLVVATREASVGASRPEVDRLAGIALAFVLDAQTSDGRSHNRMSRSGQWTDAPTTDDCWGRSLWGLGVAASQGSTAAIRERALVGFETGARRRSTWARAMSFAALGAAEVAARHEGHRDALGLLADTVEVIGPLTVGSWSWPEPRLRYANAVLAEAVIAAGAALGRDDHVERGLIMLRWLLALETGSGHVSVTGVDGRGPHDARRQFDQQPIEVAALADACWRAQNVSADRDWPTGVDLAAAWFDGHNDTREVMYDPLSGGGFDGLQASGVNLNQGAESTMAYISTRQRARSLAISA